MTKRYCMIGALLLLMALTTFALGQFRSQELGGGMNVGVGVGNVDPGWDSEGGLAVRAFLRRNLSDAIELEVGAGSVKLNGDDYETTLNPVDLRLLLRPLVKEYWSPYLFAGVGGVHYDVQEFPAQVAADTEAEGWSAYVPFGAGLQLKLSDDVSFELNGTYGFSFTDDLNLIEEDNDDAFLTGSVGLTMGGFNWSGDPDLDGLTNREEKELGTDMQVADSDGDGLNDGEEFFQHKTNPLEADSDGDQLSDYAEVKTHQTNPNKADSDDDGLSDKEEVDTHKTNPMKADSDEDGLNDKAELMTHKTDPLKKDTDGDGLSDGAEVMTHKTDPAKADSDGDGLNDGAEVNTHKTNPLKADSDGGSVADGTEVNRGTNPNDAKDDVVLDVKEVGAKIVLEGIRFATGKATISDQSEEVLSKALNTLKAYPDMSVEIRGYTDNTGSLSFNQSLSQRRAEAVRTWLVQKGINGSRITAKGMGPQDPIASNATAEGRAKNRRIEFVRTK